MCKILRSWAITGCMFIASASVQLHAQESELQSGHPAYRLLERIEIKSGSLQNNLYLDALPISRADMNRALKAGEALDSINPLTAADMWWRDYAFIDNFPFGGAEYWKRSHKQLPANIYSTPANFFAYSDNDTGGSWFIINPVIQFRAGMQSVQDTAASGRIFRNTRGIELRGAIDGKLGFYSYLAENQEILPYQASLYKDQTKLLPGQAYTKNYKKGGADYFTARGYITFSPTRHIRFLFGNYSNKIGSGYRSLLLSDFAADYLHLKITTRIWKIQYQNIFAELRDGQRLNVKPYPTKYLAAHYLSINVFKWLNAGLFESIVFANPRGRSRGFDFAYLNPVIFYRAVESNISSADNALVGANINAIALRRFRIYSQVALDEFRVTELFKNNRGWWGNKYGIQAGVNYVDAFNVKNLNLRLEYNQVRPYTYSSDSSSLNYQTYAQSLAHPNKANFKEWLFIASYAPYKSLLLTGKLRLLNQGLDPSAAMNYGSDLFKSYNTRLREYGNFTGQGINTQSYILELCGSYQLRHNLTADISAQRGRSAVTAKDYYYVSLGLGLNFIEPDRLY